MTLLKDPTVVEAWVPEEQVELWQIKHFDEKQERDKLRANEEKQRKYSTKRPQSNHRTNTEVDNSSGADRSNALDNGFAAGDSRMQKITAVAKEDGQIEIRGLQPDQQIIQLPNGDIHVATPITSNTNGEVTFILGPKIPIPTSNCFEVIEMKPQEQCNLSQASSSFVTPTPHTSVSPHLLQQVVSQALTQTRNPDVREKLLTMQKLIQQKTHPGIPRDISNEMSSHRNIPPPSLLNKTPKNAPPSVNQEEKEGQSRMLICAQVVRHLLDTVERNERNESKSLKKQEIQRSRVKQIALSKLEVLLQKRKETLRRDILYKNMILESTMRDKIQKGAVDKDREPMQKNTQNKLDSEVISEMENTTNVSSKFSLTSSFNISQADHVSSPKKKRQKTESDTSFEELYCICNTPYDSSKFYIGCDHCENWFHGSCVGITKTEAEKLDTYSCPNCRQMSSRTTPDNATLTDSHRQEVEKVLTNLKMHKNAWPFLQPVDAKEVPDYYSIITQPMDLSTIEKKLQAGRYKLLPEFINDVMKIFDNCRYYNARNTQFYRCAEVLEIYFSDKLRSLRTRLKLS